MTTTPPRTRLNAREAAAYLAAIGCPFTFGTLEVWRSRGRGPRFHRVGGRVFYAPADLDAFAAGTPVETTHAALRGRRRG